MSAGGWTDKQDAVRPRNGIFFGHSESEGLTRYDGDEPWTRDAVRKQPDPRGHVLRDSIYMKMPDEASPWAQKADYKVARDGEEE